MNKINSIIKETIDKNGYEVIMDTFGNKKNMYIEDAYQNYFDEEESLDEQQWSLVMEFDGYKVYVPIDSYDYFKLKNYFFDMSLEKKFDFELTTKLYKKRKTDIISNEIKQYFEAQVVGLTLLGVRKYADIS